ncbi:hypothetical protein ACFWUZ_19710 [Streptomyces sp. NPDC058646]|uniref:hypothetical protein n=1 Tax=Streptomyces sp. NPDC058646 TaxID=3346574 RepID=UPI00364C453E
MGADVRTAARMGPLPHRSKWVAGSALASFALVLAGVAGPALAAPQGQHAGGGAAVRDLPGTGGDGGTDCTRPKAAKPSPDQANARLQDPKDKCVQGPAGPPGPPGPQGPAGPPGPVVCSDVDAYKPSNSEEVKAVLTGGRAYAGIRNLQVMGSPGPFRWYDLTDTPGNNFPDGACAISIASQTSAAGGVSIEVLTEDGAVYETTCSIDNEAGNRVLDCTESWVELTPGHPAPNDNGTVTARIHPDLQKPAARTVSDSSKRS